MGGARAGQTASDECEATYKTDGKCMDDGSSAYTDLQLEYSSATGLFNGTMITNQCNAKNNTEFSASPSCIEVVCPPTCRPLPHMLILVCTQVKMQLGGTPWHSGYEC